MAAAHSAHMHTGIPPRELTERAQWVTWRREMRNGKLTKIPYNPKTGKKAKSNDPLSWGTYEEACIATQLHRADGIGYEFSPGDPFAGVDLDHCRNPETGEITAPARIIIDTFASYAELSPSGTGVHIIIRAAMPGSGRGRKRGSYEAYSQRRFFTMTGQHLEDTPATIEERQDELERFIAHYLARPEKQHQQRAAAPTRRGACEASPAGLSLDDSELLLRARNNPDPAKAARFQRLYDVGDISGYKSQSEADAALCNDLAYMCGPNAEERVAQLFRSSALYREKAERDDYVTNTVALAYEGRTAFYTPRGITVEKSIEKKSIEKTAPAFSADVLEALDAGAADGMTLPELRAALARIRELEHENAAQRQEITSLRASVASMNGKLQDIRNIIDADGLQVAPLEKVLEVDLLLTAIWPSHETRRDPDGFVPILIETPRDAKTGEKIKGVVGLADKHGVSRGTISKALDALNAMGGARIVTTKPEVQPNGTYRAYTKVAPPVRLQPKDWVRPDGPRKQMGGARPGAGRKAKCATPECGGDLVERRGVETKEHEFIETRCTGACGEVTRRYTGVVASLGLRWVGDNQLIFDAADLGGDIHVGADPGEAGSDNQLISEARDAGSDAIKSAPHTSVDASIVRNLENVPDARGETLEELRIYAQPAPPPPCPACPDCGGGTYRDPLRRIVCRSCLVPIAPERLTTEAS